MPMQDPGESTGHPKQAYFDNLSKSSETVTWYTAKASASVLTDYVLELLSLQISQLRAFGSVGAEPEDESLLLSLVSAPQGAAVTVWAQSPFGAQRINYGLQREHEEMRESLSRGTYMGNRAQAWAIPLNFGHSTDSSEWDELYSLLDDGTIVEFGEWGSVDE